jgi:hypothetical protein
MADIPSAPVPLQPGRGATALLALLALAGGPAEGRQRIVTMPGGTSTLPVVYIHWRGACRATVWAQQPGVNSPGCLRYRSRPGSRQDRLCGAVVEAWIAAGMPRAADLNCRVMALFTPPIRSTPSGHRARVSPEVGGVQVVILARPAGLGRGGLVAVA